MNRLLLWLRLELLLRSWCYTATNRSYFYSGVELDTRDGDLCARHLSHCAIALLLLLGLDGIGLYTLCKLFLVVHLSGVERRLGCIVEDTRAGAGVLSRHVHTLLLRLDLLLHPTYTLLALNGLHCLLEELPILAVVAPTIKDSLRSMLLLLGVARDWAMVVTLHPILPFCQVFKL